MANWFGCNPAVKRLERPEAKHNVLKIKETKTQTISHPDDAVTKDLNRKEENNTVIFFCLFVVVAVF